MRTVHLARKDTARIFSIAAATLLLLTGSAPDASCQRTNWGDRLIATSAYMQHHMWNPATGNFVRRADQPSAPGSDSWGITIVLDAYAYMVQSGYMKADELKRYYESSSALYNKTDGDRGARVLARQGSQIYVGGDDDLQWAAALVHCYEVTHDSTYLNTARWAFNALIDLGFWKDGAQDKSGAKGWAWNSGDQRPNGVSTAYGALASARLYRATHENVYKQWTAAALLALETPQVGFFPRDMMVATQAALVIYDVSRENVYLAEANDLARVAKQQADEILAGKRTGERNPTDVGDLAEGFYDLARVTGTKSYAAYAKKLIDFFVGSRTTEDIQNRGFFSRYTTNGAVDSNGSYLGVPLSVPFLPEVAEMLKLFAKAAIQ